MKKIFLIFMLAIFCVGMSAQKKPISFYIGVGGTYASPSMGGITPTAGVVFHNHELQLSYTLGLSKSDPVHWYDNAGLWLSTTTYQQRSFAVQYGYRFGLKHGIFITPQVGYSLKMLSASLQDGTGKYGDKAKASCLSIGAKFQYSPVKHLVIFLSPEYRLAVSQDTYYKHTADISNFSASGFAVSAGLMFCF